MEKVEFGISWKMTSYCYGEIANFQECASNIDPLELRNRYLEFLENFGSVKKSTLVDPDVLQLFMGDIDNRADIDYREGHWDDDPEICAGGKRFAQRWAKLKRIHSKPNARRTPDNLSARAI
jgi:hypothetical protein